MNAQTTSTLNNILQLLLAACLLLNTTAEAQDAASEGKLSVVVGNVTIQAKDRPGVVKAKVGDRVSIGSTIKTGAGSRAVLVTTRQSAVRISENSELVVNELVDSNKTPKVLLDLKNGSLGALIQPQAQSAMDFRIKTPSGVAAARGTFYAVAVEDGKKGFVQVKEGKIAITPAVPKGKEAVPGTVSEISGSLSSIAKEGGAEKPLKVGDKVALGSTLKTGPKSTAVVRLTDDSAISMTSNTETVLETVNNDKAAPKVLLDLKSGTMSALIKPQAKGKMDFRIKTPSGVAAARGTFYSVSVENGRGYVKVKEGEVKVIPSKEEAE